MNQASVGFHCPECARAGAQRVIDARQLTSWRPRVTIALIVVNVVIFFAQDALIGGRRVVDWGFLLGPAVAAGDWWRIATSGFLHGSLMHLGFNMYALWIFGQPLERTLGTARFALAYVAGLFGGGLAVLVFNYDVPTLGASGAVLGLAGALAAVLWARGVKLTQTSLFGLFIINLALPLLVPRISFWGHLGGIAAGFAAGWLLSWLPERFGRPTNLASAATVALCAALFLAALTIP